MEDEDFFETSVPPVAVHIGISSLGNPGPAAWAACITNPLADAQIISEVVASATSPATSIRAFVAVLRALPEGTQGVVWSRDKEAITSIRERLAKWQGNGWRTAGKKPVANRDLWYGFVALQPKFPELSFEWAETPGDIGSRMEEAAERLARAYQAELRRNPPEPGAV